MLSKILAWFDTRYTPLALAADRAPPQGFIQFILYFVRQFRTAFLFRLGLTAIGSVADAMVPIFVGMVIGFLASTAPGAMFTEHGGALLAMAAVIVLARPLSFVLDMLVRNHAIVPNLIDQARWQSHWHVVRQSWTYFQNDFAGRIANKVMQLGDAIEEPVNQLIDSVWYALVFLVVAVVTMGALDWTLLLPVVVWLVLYGLLFTRYMPVIAQHSERLSDAYSALTGRVVDSYTNIATVKTFSGSAYEDQYVAEAVTTHVGVFRQMMRKFTEMWSLLFVINAVLVVSVTWIALAGWNEGRLSPTAVATAIPFVLQIMSMSGWILDNGTSIFRQLGTARDCMKTIAKPIALFDASDATELKVTAGGIAFEQVHFNYWRGKEGSVMADFSLAIAPGEKIGLVGRSGAGKSTLVNLLLRLFDVEAGTVHIDGQDIAKVTQDSLRAAIGLVSQDTSLLHRSVRDNIKYGRPDASDEAMIAAARQAKVDDVVGSLVDPEGRKGYDAHVGERGVKLSGGQRQRVAIARVLLKNAPILVLDEATSALDSEVEAAIQEQLQSLMAGKTVIAIAHRLSTIAAMDRLVVLDAGKIVEEGSHAQLLAQGGHYAQLWERQSGGFLDLGSKAAG